VGDFSLQGLKQNSLVDVQISVLNQEGNKKERKKERRKEGRKKRSIQVSETKTKQKKKELWLKQHSGFINKE